MTNTLGNLFQYKQKPFKDGLLNVEQKHRTNELLPSSLPIFV